VAIRPCSEVRAQKRMSRGLKAIVPKNHGDDPQQRRDKLLLALLKTSPQPRPKRVRAKAKLNDARATQKPQLKSGKRKV